MDSAGFDTAGFAALESADSLLCGAFDADDALPSALDETADEPETSRAENRRGWVGLLRDLGYLEPTGEPCAGAIDGALAELLDGLAEVPELAALDPRLEGSLLAWDRLEEALTRLLLLDAPDGPTRLPAHGERSPWSRIVQSRLERLGLKADGNVGDPFASADADGLRLLCAVIAPPEQFAGQLERADAVTGLRLSNEADRLIESIRARDRAGYLVSYQGDASFPPPSFAPGLRVDPRSGRFEGGGGLFAAIAALGRRHAHEPLHGNHRDALEDRGNQLGLRLAQIKLYQAGLYHGLIDGALGKASRSALDEAAALFLSGDDSGDDERDNPVLRSLGSGYWALNLHCFADRFHRLEPDERVLADAADATVDPAIDQGIEQVVGHFAAQPERRRSELGLFQRITARIRRRILRPLGRLFRTAFAALQRGAQWLIRQLARGLRAVGDILRTLVGYARRAWQMLRRGWRPFVHFVFGWPIASDHVLVRFDRDRDAVCYVQRDAPPAELLFHTALVRRVARAADRGLTIVGKAVELVQTLSLRLATPAGWALLAWRLGGFMRWIVTRGAVA